MSTGLWFATPAWGRYELSAVCFDQRQHVIDTLAKNGIEAHCVVVADDENLDLARERGFAVVERDNEYLGRKFNDGIEYAGRHGATWIVPIGSDSWIDPAYFLPIPGRHGTRTSSLYAVVEPARMAACRVRTPAGAGPYVFHRSLLGPGFRPADDLKLRHVDSSMVKGLSARPAWAPRNVHAFQYVGFRGKPHLTPYSVLQQKWGVREYPSPWPILAEHYPGHLVERARVALGLPQ
jgi:hypothetical protein